MANIFAPGGVELAKRSDVPISIKTGLIKNPTGTPQDFFSTTDDDQYKFSFMQNASTIATQTTVGNWEPMIGFRMMNVYGGLAIDIDNPIVKMWGGANSSIHWSDQIVFKSEYDKLVKRVTALEKQIGGVLSSLLNHIADYVTFNDVLEVA